MPNYTAVQGLYDVFTEGTTLAIPAAATNYAHISLPNWPNKALLKRIKISAVANAVTGPLDIKILSDPAAYRAAAAPGDIEYTVAVWNNEPGMGAPYTTWVLDEQAGDGANTWDDTLSNKLHLYLYSEGLSAPTAFHIEAWGEKLIEDRLERSFYEPNYMAAMWRNNSTTNVWTDMTSQALSKRFYRQSGNEFFLQAAASTTEYFYIGAAYPFRKVHFDVHAANTTHVTPTWEYWNGTAWAALTVFDCTDARLSGDEYPFSYSGVVYWTAPATWNRLAIDDTEGTPPDSQPRYWVRCGLTDISTNPEFYSVRLMPV